MPDFPDHPIRPNPVRTAHDPQEGFSQESFHSPRAIQLQYVELGVDNQRKVQLEPHPELRMRFRIAAAAANHHRVALFEFLEGVTKLGRFVRSTGRIRFGEKIEDHVLAAKIGKRNRLSLVSRSLKLRRAVPFLQHRDPR
jgi:hypothetical protein